MQILILNLIHKSQHNTDIYRSTRYVHAFLRIRLQHVFINSCINVKAATLHTGVDAISECISSSGLSVATNLPTEGHAGSDPSHQLHGLTNVGQIK